MAARTARPQRAGRPVTERQRRRRFRSESQ